MRQQIWVEGQENDEHFKYPTNIPQQLDECWLMRVPKFQWDTWRKSIQQAKVTEVSSPDYERPPEIEKSNMTHGDFNENTGFGHQTFMFHSQNFSVGRFRSR